jgi:hypothetical protein
LRVAAIADEDTRGVAGWWCTQGNGYGKLGRGWEREEEGRGRGSGKVVRCKRERTVE